MDEQIQYHEGEAAVYADSSPLRKARYFAVTGIFLTLVSMIYSFFNPYSLGLSIQDYITLSYVSSWCNQLCFIIVGWMMLKVGNGYIRQAGILMLASMGVLFVTTVLYYASLIPQEYSTTISVISYIISYIMLIASLIMFFIEGNCSREHVFVLCLIYTVLLGLTCASQFSHEMSEMSMYQTSYVFLAIRAIAVFFAFKPWWRLLSDATPEASSPDQVGSLIGNMTNQGVIGFITSVIIMISIIKILSITL